MENSHSQDCIKVPYPSTMSCIILQLAKERAEEIDRDNFTLLKKMQQIMKTEGGGVDHKNTYRHHRCAACCIMIII